MKKKEIFKLIGDANGIDVSYVGNDNFKIKTGNLYKVCSIFDENGDIGEPSIKNLRSTDNIEDALLVRNKLKKDEIKRITPFIEDIELVYKTLSSLSETSRNNKVDFLEFLKENDLQYIRTINDTDFYKTKDEEVIACFEDRYITTTNFYDFDNLFKAKVKPGYNEDLEVFYYRVNDDLSEFLKHVQDLFLTYTGKKFLDDKIDRLKKRVFEDDVMSAELDNILVELKECFSQRSELPDSVDLTDEEVNQLGYLFSPERDDIIPFSLNLYNKVKYWNVLNIESHTRIEVPRLETPDINNSIILDLMNKFSIDKLSDDLTREVILHNSRIPKDFDLTKDLTDSKMYCEEPKGSILDVFGNKEEKVKFYKILPLFKKARIVPLNLIAQTLGENKKSSIATIRELANLGYFKQISFDDTNTLVFFDNDARSYYNSLSEQTKEDILFQLSPDDGSVKRFFRELEDNYDKLKRLNDDRVNKHLEEFLVKKDKLKDSLEVNPESVNLVAKVNAIHLPNLIEIVKESEDEYPVDRGFEMVLQAFDTLIDRIQEEKDFDINSKLNAMEISFKMDDLL